MKILIIIFALIAAIAQEISAQDINWKSQGKPNLIYQNFGYDFGVTERLGYGRRLMIAGKPVLMTLDYSFPMGKNLTDDFKVRLGGQVEIFESRGFALSARVQGNFRRYQTKLVRIVSFGSEMSAVAGYYRPTWHAAAEWGFDKSIVSHLKNSAIMRSYYPAIHDGWYLPSGGHWFYGIEGGKSLGRSFDVSLRLGLTNAQGSDENAMLPYYAQIGVSKSL